MLNLDVIYDVTIAIKWEKVHKNEYVIYPTTSLPSSWFYFYLWPYKHAVLTVAGAKAIATDNPEINIFRKNEPRDDIILILNHLLQCKVHKKDGLRALS